MQCISSSGILAGVTQRTFDVLVVGSGASGLAAAVSPSAPARVGLATKGSIQACNSAAQGGIQASFGDDDSPEQHAADIFKSSHESADMRLVEVLTGDAQSAIHWLEELGVEFTRENGGYRLARCGGATAKRLLQVGDRTGTRSRRRFATRSRRAAEPCSRTAPCRRSNQATTAGARPGGEHELDAATVVLAAGAAASRSRRSGASSRRTTRTRPAR